MTSTINRALPASNSPLLSVDVRGNFQAAANDIEALQASDASKAPIANPTFTGTVGLPAGQAVNGIILRSDLAITTFLSGDGTYRTPAGGGGGGTWGSITGTLSSQTDLQTALNAKAPIASPTFTGTVGGITATMVGAPSGSGTSTGANTGDQTITLTGDVTGTGTGSFVAAVSNAAVIGKVLTGFTAGAGAVASTDNILQAFQKVVGNASTPAAPRVVALTDAATVTPNCGTTDIGTLLTLSQTSVLANPTGSPVSGQRLIIRIKSTAIQNISFGSQYRSSNDITLPTATTGGSKTDYLGFIWNSVDSTWDYISKNLGF